MAQRRRIRRTTIDPVAALSDSDRLAMFELMDRYYRGMSRVQFDADLAAKDHLIRMFDQDDLLCGFSTIQRLWLDYEGRRLLVVFSGDTVIDRDCWGQKALQAGFTRYLVRTWLERPFRPLYWFLISKGFKTYLLMRHNFASWPNHREELPAEVRAVLDHAAQAKYPQLYDPERGLIVAPRGEDAQAVKAPYLELSEEELSNPEIRYFVARNPEHHLGDELCCLAKVRLRELLWIGLKYGLWHPLRRLLGLGPKRKAAPETAEAPAPASETS
ncbi:MAG TPA: hypothetical protein DEA08_19450 [Planctomycetes bacterium]|mgnify:CR=1 FL=1|nr:hypothetical protein [Planctomycetota bacterium]